MDALDELIGETRRDGGIGHNDPPDEIAALRERLETTSDALLRRRDELLAASSRVPAAIDDEETCGKVADYIKQVAACAKAAEGARIAAKEPHLAAGRVVDGFFKAVTDPLDKLKRQIEARLTDYQRRKAEAERRRREEEARRQAAEAERARREAEAAAAAIATEADLVPAIGAEEQARQAAADAALAAKGAAAKPAELSRSRGDYGAVASLRTFWDFRDLDRNTVDLETLRPHLPLDAIEKAVRSYIRAGGRKLRGCEIFENTTTAVR